MKNTGHYILASVISAFMLSEVNSILLKGLIAVIVGILISAMASIDKTNGDKNESK